ncbi:glycosyltransferase family 2 protein [Megamonas funiformis]|uniref:glycosyltransferase family 2 protein n=1 Tax=Megamonas funiformis TaxID=437897 RepID=UPI00388D2E63
MEKIYKVSIIVPVYNVEKYIKRCLDSLINQTYKNLEIILIDDGSTDASGVICDQYRIEDNRIKVIHQKNSGLPSARNTGIDNITGNIVMFIDSDDWIDEDCVEKCIKEFKASNKLECILFPYIREFENISKPVYFLGKNEKLFINNDIRKYIHRRLFGPINEELKKPDSMNDLNTAWGKIYLSKFIKDIRFTDVKYIGSAEDCYFNMQLFNKFKVVKYIPYIKYHYNKINQTSIVHKYNENLEKTRNNLYMYAQELINKNNYNNNYKEALFNRIVLDILDLVRNIMNSNLSLYLKYKLVKNILNSKIRKEYLNRFDISLLNFKWKIYYFFCKKKIVIGVRGMPFLAERLKKYLR